jgi:hypothetical protein
MIKKTEGDFFLEITLQGCRNKAKLQYKNFEIFKNDSTWAENTKNNESNGPKGPHTPHEN